jgi:hypothetical protein
METLMIDAGSPSIVRTWKPQSIPDHALFLLEPLSHVMRLQKGASSVFSQILKLGRRGWDAEQFRHSDIAQGRLLGGKGFVEWRHVE